MAAASAGPYANLHLAPDRQPRQHSITQFLQARCPSCHPTNSSKHWRQRITNKLIKNKTKQRCCKNNASC